MLVESHARKIERQRLNGDGGFVGKMHETSLRQHHTATHEHQLHADVRPVLLHDARQ